MASQRRSLLSLSLASLALFAAACNCQGKEGPKGSQGTQPEGPVAVADAGVAAPDAPPKATAENVAPVIREFGWPDALPGKVVIEFSIPVVDGTKVNRPAGEKSVFRITPEVKGSLVYTGPSTLAWTPASPLDFATEYRVSLESLETNSGVLSAPGSGVWGHTFKTPGFKFARASLNQVDLKSKRVTVDVAFTGPVTPSDAQKFLSFKLDGNPVAATSVVATDKWHVVRATVTSASLAPKSKLRVTVKSGLPSQGGKAKAEGAESTIEVYGGKAMTVSYAYLREGPNGHYIDVNCRDEAAEAAAQARAAAARAGTTTDDDDSEGTDEEGGEGEFDEGEGSDDGYYYQQRGCTLDEDLALENIRFSPPVKFYTSQTRSGFRIFGDFKRGSYSMLMEPGLSTTEGGVLLRAFEQAFSVAARKPQISFAANGRYLARSAWKSLPLNHLNVEEAEITISQVPVENLVFWLGDDSSENVSERVGNVIVKKKLQLRGQPDTQGTSYQDVSQLVPPNTKGLLQLTLTAPSANPTSSRLLLTDMSLVAKKSPPPPGKQSSGEVRVWALGIDSNELLSGVEVQLVKKSGFVLATCQTSGADGCLLKDTEFGQDPYPPFALIARRGDDLTFIKYAELKTDISESDVFGEAFASEKAYRASIYSDRGVYRPGETAHLGVIVRGRDDRAPPAGLPVELSLTDPRARVSKKVILKTNEAGLLNYDASFSDFADTGVYTVSLKVADKPLASYSFNVEEFVPERMKVEAKGQKDSYGLNEKVEVAVFAKYLFGGTADGNPVEMTCRLEPSTFKPKENANYSYGIWRKGGREMRALALPPVKGELDETGNAVLSCPTLTAAGSFKGPARVSAQLSVFEAGSGRSTVGRTSVPVHPEAYYLGLLAGDQKVEAGKPFTVQGIVVDWNGKPVSAVTELDLETVRLEEEYGYFYDEDTSEDRYQRWLRPAREGKSKVPVSGGKFTITVTPTQNSAGYLVRVKSGGAQTDLQLEGKFRNYWWADGENQVDQTPRPAKATSLELSAPSSVKVGANTEVKFKAPYPGRALFTVETDSLVKSEWKEVKAGENAFSFAVEKFAPNVYVSAFLVKDPHLESKEAYMPDRAFGVMSIRVEPTEFTQDVKIDAPDEIRSASTLNLSLELGPQEGPAYATVAVVDEGILSLTGFQTPNPNGELFTKRALAVETYETIGWTMLVAPQGPTSSTGGDEEGAAPGRVQPVKPVALWSGVVPVPKDGKVKVAFDVPQYRGQLRVMAITTSASKVGRAEKKITVKDPIVLQTTLPRFITFGDEIQIPVFVTNLSGGDLDVKVSLSAEALAVPGTVFSEPQGSPLQLLGKPEGTVKLTNGAAKTIVFQAKATKASGAAKLRVVAQGGSHTSREELDVPFYPAGPKTRETQRIELVEGEVDLKNYLEDWMPQSESSSFWVTANPYGETFDHLKYLVRYPYGCIEQTTSSTRPLLFVRNLVEQVDPTLAANGKVEDMVMSGINRVLSMQTPSGGFGYWPGDTHPNPWGTAYATHMLIDAQKAGYAVPQDRLDDAVKFIGNKLTAFENGVSSSDRWEQVYAEGYMHYVLALAGKGRKARIQKLVDELPKKQKEYSYYHSAAEDEYLLQAALWFAGDHRYEKQLRNPDVSTLTDVRKNDWSFYSDRRRRGFMLSTFQDMFGSDAAGEPLAQLVANGLTGQQSYWYTTQELVWGITGLGKRVADSAASFKPPVLTANGKSLEPKAAKRSADRSWSIPRASEYKSLKLDLPDKGEGKVYLIVSSEGVKVNGEYKVGGNGLSITRNYKTLEGGEIDVLGGGATLADMIFVEIQIRNTSNERIQNIALVDRLPAGWEIENPRLGRGGAVNWVEKDDLWEADYMNVRDDRLELFGALERGQSKTVIYAARAVTAGTFTLPPVEAEAMYDPRIWAREAGGTTKVAGPWADELL